jgi:hypothetical protein
MVNSEPTPVGVNFHAELQVQVEVPVRLYVPAMFCIVRNVEVPVRRQKVPVLGGGGATGAGVPHLDVVNLVVQELPEPQLSSCKLKEGNVTIFIHFWLKRL